jgi:hypothetical protein
MMKTMVDITIADTMSTIAAATECLGIVETLESISLRVVHSRLQSCLAVEFILST